MGEDRFGQIAAEYDLWPLVDPNYTPLQNAVAERVSSVHPSRTIKVMEIGTGTGHSAETLLERYRLNVLLDGLDLSSEMLALAGYRLKDYSDVRLHHGDASDLDAWGVPDYDCVYSVCTLHNITPNKRLAVCRNAWESLVPGGLWVSGDKVTPDDPAAYLHLWDYWIRNLELFRERGMEEAYKFWRLHELEDHLTRITESETIAMMAAAGFKEIKVVERFGIYALITGRKP